MAMVASRRASDKVLCLLRASQAGRHIKFLLKNSESSTVSSGSFQATQALQEIGRCQSSSSSISTTIAPLCRQKIDAVSSRQRTQLLPSSPRFISSTPCVSAEARKDTRESRAMARQDEDPFDTITDRIPERPVSVAEAGSYSIVILAGLALAGAAAYAVVRELLLQPQEYLVFGKALERVQNDNRVTVRLGQPITGYGQESRNRATRQRISNKIWHDEDGVERIQVQFYIRGPQGAGIVRSEMFKDKEDRGKLKFTYLLVDITSPVHTRIMLESYIPSANFGI